MNAVGSASLRELPRAEGVGSRGWRKIAHVTLAAAERHNPWYFSLVPTDLLHPMAQIGVSIRGTASSGAMRYGWSE
jgi:hypothetical protein